MNQNQIGATTSAGSIWMNTGGWTGISFSMTTSYKELASLSTAFTLSSPATDFAMTADGRLRYTGKDPRRFIATGFLSCGASASYALAIYKNGSIITGSDSYCVSGVVLATTPITSLSTDDYISLFVKRNSSASVNILQIILELESYL